MSGYNKLKVNSINLDSAASKTFNGSKPLGLKSLRSPIALNEASKGSKEDIGNQTLPVIKQ